ncbi:MAG: EAL domain-containing protein [Sulfuritalea sp.]|nr:EAL domain-containing protein [Sulfuritalea sp.]
MSSLPWRSLQVRVTLVTLAIFLLGIWSLAYYASRTLREDMQKLLGEQQFSTASLLAAELNASFAERVNALEVAARELAAIDIGDRKSLQRFLEMQNSLHSRFNGGLMIFDAKSTAIAEVPNAVGRVGANYKSRDYLIGALGDEKTTVGAPIAGPKLGAPVFVIATPIRNSRGIVVGAIGGVTNLGAPNFLDGLAVHTYLGGDGYLLVTAGQRLIVSATDKSRIMDALPPRGANSQIDRLIQGFDGSILLTNPRGDEVLMSAKHVPIANWDLLVSLPTATAFAPIYSMQERMLKATGVLTLLAALLVGWMLRKLLSPLVRAAKALASSSRTDHLMQPLTVSRQDEVGELIGGFNKLMEKLKLREQALLQSESRFRALSTMSSDWFWQQDENFRFVEFSEAFANGFTVQVDAVGKTRWELDIKLTPEQWASHRDTLEAHLPFRNFEYPIANASGEERWYSISGEPLFDDTGRFVGYHGTGRDTTKQKNAEQDMRIAAAAFESQECMMVTDASGVILRVNRAFTELTGFEPEDIVGLTPRVLKSGRHGPEFYRAMWESISSTGGWQGEIWGQRKNGEIYPKWLSISEVRNEAGEVTHYIGSHYDITERKRAEERINELAFFDPLTSLPNRRLLLDRLKQAMAASARSAKHGALLFIDLDNFKTLNDTLGHDTGDMLLQQVAERLRNCVRETDTVARLGGDEFVVMLEDLSANAGEAATQAEVVGEKILASLNQNYQLGRKNHHNTPSIGITLFAGHRCTMDELLKWADLAMYQAKAAGRNTLRFFDPEMQAVVTARAAIEADLNEALLKNQFQLYYQAQVDEQGKLTGVEALIRWRHPVRGLVSPAEFIPVAEDSGLIVTLGRWVVKTACAQLAAWAERPGMENLTIAVNVSARQFHHNDFVAQVLAAIEHTGANPARLKLELTESMLANDVDEIIAKMTSLKAKGVAFSLDDFGTGYSSLSYLKRLPLDQLKIDQSFVRDILTDANDAAIARTVIALADSMGLAVIAEGVETEAQRELLAHQGCHAYQGYLFSRPLPIEAFEAWNTGSAATAQESAPARASGVVLH